MIKFTAVSVVLYLVNRCMKQALKRFWMLSNCKIGACV